MNSGAGAPAQAGPSREGSRQPMVMRYVALLRSPAPLGGVCPACHGIMDETGCRIGDHFVSRDPVRTRGIARVVEVFCHGTPTGPVRECPACR